MRARFWSGLDGGSSRLLADALTVEEDLRPRVATLEALVDRLAAEEAATRRELREGLAEGALP